MLRRRIAASVVLAGFAALANGVAAASAAQPVKGSHFYGFEGGNSVDNFWETSAELQVSRSGRGFGRSRGGSYVEMTFGSRCDRYDSRVRLSPRVRIRRGGRFSLADGRGARRFRLRGRFLTAGYARVAYRARVSRRGRDCRTRGTVSLYRNGEPPFSGCRTQRARTVLRTGGARVFRQFRRVPNSTGFFPHVYACVLDNGRRFALGRDYDDERIEVPRLVDPFVAFASVECGGVGCSGGIVVLDLRNGARRPVGSVHSPPGGFPTTIPDLEVKDNGSIAWIVRTYREPRNASSEVREVWVLDTRGKRMLDSGLGIALDSLRLSGSTVSWVKDGAARTAPID